MRHRFPFFTLGLGVLVAISSAIAAENTQAKGPKPVRISMGRKVNLADYLVPGKTTIFDFTSEFCPPCRAIAPYMEKLHLTRDDISVVNVDINRPMMRGIDWSSPVAKQYGVQSVPQFKVFGPDGRLLAEGEAAGHMVMSWLK